MKVSIACTDFRPFHRNTLRGFATVKLPDLRLTIRDIAVHQHTSGSRWAQLPAKPMIDNAGVAKRTAEGRVRSLIRVRGPRGARYLLDRGGSRRARF